jgi:hypothetical protein
MSRSSENDSATPRRRFIGELAASAAALAAVACTPAAAATSASSQAPAPSAPTPAASTDQLPGQSEMKWDTSWMARITAKHKAVFDSPEINDGNALYLADSYFGWVKNVFGSGESDASVVVVLRHSAVPLLYNDAMWSKYPVGSLTKTVDPKTKASARRNTFYRKLDKDGKPSGDEKPSATIESLTKRGVIFVGCDLATRGFAYEIAQKTKQNERSIYEDLRSNLVPAATLMTTGIFATLLAQEAGCSFMSAS